MKPIFLEIVIAPDFTDEAMEIFATKKNLRVIQVDMTPSTEAIDQYVSVNGGLLVQHLDTQIETITADMCATKVQPDAATLADMQFGWNIVKHVKSNAIVVVKNGQTLGVGAGQMNRVGSAEIAMKQAHAAGVTEGASVVDPNKCIGCGVCTTKCEFNAIKLHRERPECSNMIPSEKKLPYVLGNGAKQALKIKFSKKKEK